MFGRRSKKRAADGGFGVESTARAAKPKPARPVRPGPRGWPGVGGGVSTLVSDPPLWRGTTRQVCGLWPYTAGTGSPVIGAPLGRHLFTGAMVCGDPMSWFMDASIISNPSAFVLGLPGLGKSTLVRSWVTALAGFGVVPMILGDLRPDYVDLIEAMDGQVIRVGRGRGHLNVLDPGDAVRAAQKLSEAGRDDLAREVREESLSRRRAVVASLVTILRRGEEQQAPSQREESVLDGALRILDRDFDGVPTLPDLLAVIRSAPSELREAAVAYESTKKYRKIVENLEASLVSMISGGLLGDTFSKPTTEAIRVDRPMVIDISGLGEGEESLKAATLIACWSAGFGTVSVANQLAEANLGPRRHYFLVLDELWQALSAGEGIVDRLNSVSRMNRGFGVGQVFITHTMHDLETPSREEDRRKARGLVERSGMVVMGGLPRGEMEMLTRVVHLSSAEQSLLQSWSSPPTFDQKTGREKEPPGRGRFLIKVGGRPGIPLRTELTRTELAIGDTNKRWRTQAATAGEETAA